MRRFFAAVLIAISGTANAADVKCCVTQNPGPQSGLCLAGSSNHLWKPGQELRVRFLDGSPSLQKRVEMAAMEWTHFANIKFLFVASEPSDIRIAFQQGAGSWSTVGTTSQSVQASQPTMNFGWFNDLTDDAEIRRTTLHEFGHALGMIHEHQSPNANIPWDKPAVYKYYRESQAPPWDVARVDYNIFRTYTASNTNFTAFDRESIMLYPIPNAHTVGDFEIQANSVLSPVDKSHIAKLYPGAVKRSYTVKMATLQCIKRQEVFGNDEIHLRVFADGNALAVPHNKQTPVKQTPIFRMTSGDTVSLNITATFERTLKVEVWDIDNPEQGDEHDLFGCITISKEGAGSESIQDATGLFEKRTHHYQLYWE